MKGILVTLAFLISVALASNVVELKDSNFASFIKSHPVVMVEFYSPGCTHCKAFAPEYEKAADIVAEKRKPYVLAKLDVNREGSTADAYHIGKLPTLKVFIKGLPFDYYDERDSRVLLQFLDHMYRNIFFSTEITSADELKARTELKGMQAILITNEKNLIETFKEVAKKFESVDFFHTPELVGASVFPDVMKKPAIVLLKDFDERQVTYTGGMSDKLISDFLTEHTRPKVTEFNQETIAQLFKPNGKKGVVLLRSENEEGKKAEQELRKLAVKFRSHDTLFVVSDIKEGVGERIAKKLGVKEKDLPHLEILETKGSLQRTKFEGKFVEEELNKFMQDWKAAKVEKKSDL